MRQGARLVMSAVACAKITCCKQRRINQSHTQEAQQTRLARLVCVFIQGLLQRQSLDVLQVHLELQSFCIEYVRLREAAELYRDLREMQ